MPPRRLEIDFYQLADDATLRRSRSDGTGWDWGWADSRRDWMDATPSRFAYRCLPLTIANQTGWWVRNPVGFVATWVDGDAPGCVEFRFDAAAEVWSGWISSQFGHGLITWNTPFLIRTRPDGSLLLVCGPINSFKPGAQPLTALIESDWMSMSFTMNWKVMRPGEPVRFEAGEPLFQIIPLLSNACADLEDATVTYRKLDDDPEVSRSYREWSESRDRYHRLKTEGEIGPDGWQKDYFRGRDAAGRELAPQHRTKVKPPRVQYLGSTSANGQGDAGGRRPAPAQDKSPPDSAAIAQAQATTPAAESRPARGLAGEHTCEARDTMASTGISSVAVRVDDEWRRWIAENLLLEAEPVGLAKAMVAAGIDPQEAAREINLALQSPYLRGAERLRARLKKRDWLLATYRKLNRLHPQAGKIERRPRLSRVEFLGDYYIANRPVIITGMMDDWQAMTKWNLDHFRDRFGDREVEVQMGRNAGEDYERDSKKYKRKMPFGEYVEKVRAAEVTNDFYLTANNNSNNKATLSELWSDIVQVPEYLDGSDPMAGFFWFGPAGTITPFHHDLTNNLLAQVIGRKLVKIAPSWDLPLMKNHLHVFSEIDGRLVSATPEPRAGEPQYLECVLGPGEILFLPIGCVHFVQAVGVSVTMSFTNFVFDNDFHSSYRTFHGV